MPEAVGAERSLCDQGETDPASGSTARPAGAVAVGRSSAGGAGGAGGRGEARGAFAATAKVEKGEV